MKLPCPLIAAALSIVRSRPLRVASMSMVLVFAGCSTGSLFDSDTPTPTNYVLASVPPAASAIQSRASTVDVAVARPDAQPGLDTRRIAVLTGRQLDYFRRAEWGGSVTEVVQSLLVSSFDDQKLFRSVTAEQARVSSEYVLDIEVRDFQAEYAAEGAVPQVRVTMIGRVIRIADREMIASLAASSLQPSDSNRMGEVAAAFEAAAQKVALELAGKTAQAISTDQEALASQAQRKD